MNDGHESSDARSSRHAPASIRRLALTHKTEIMSMGLPLKPPTEHPTSAIRRVRPRIQNGLVRKKLEEGRHRLAAPSECVAMNDLALIGEVLCAQP